MKYLDPLILLTASLPALLLLTGGMSHGKIMEAERAKDHRKFAPELNRLRENVVMSENRLPRRRLFSA